MMEVCLYLSLLDRFTRAASEETICEIKPAPISAKSPNVFKHSVVSSVCLMGFFFITVADLRFVL